MSVKLRKQKLSRIDEKSLLGSFKKQKSKKKYLRANFYENKTKEKTFVMQNKKKTSFACLARSVEEIEVLGPKRKFPPQKLSTACLT